MTIQKKKNLQLLLVTILVLLVIVLLYPFGSRVLNTVRDYHRPAVYGKELIYSSIENGDIRVADKILVNNYEISRFNSVVINKITWEENPYNDIYWRFNFYNLEPVRNLLFAWRMTGNPAYKDKLIEIVESFIDEGIDGPYSWDFHGASFRTMTLINVYEKLHSKNEMPVELDKKILENLKIHGDFLSDPAHFENNYNHGLDQSVALYLLAVNFPDIQGSDDWLKLASKRIVEMQENIIDKDGVLVENSPYYHFYVLEKFLEINKYLKQNHFKIDGFSEEKIDKMVSYAAYVIQPNLSIPTIGASIDRKINYFDLYKEIGSSYPNLLYILTQGVRGVKPPNLNVQYPVSGQTILRSGWGKGDKYTKQTQLIFDVGNYRTDHSDLDALSFNLFASGIALMPDAGLYTYEEGPYRSYFHGTRSHNTVVVDGKDQDMGVETDVQLAKVFSGIFEEGDGYSYQSGGNILYDGVLHERAIMLIEDSTVIIIDNLRSSSLHTYEQMFHLFPGAKINIEGLTLTARGNKPEQTLSINQYISNDIELNTVIGRNEPLDGFCSTQYKVAVPCYSVSYLQKGQNVSYVTVITIGQNIAGVNFDKKNNFLEIKTKKREFNIKINEIKNIERSIDVMKNDPVFKSKVISQPSSILDDLNLFSEWKSSDESISGLLLIDENEGSMEIKPPLDGRGFGAQKNINLDLSNQNINFKFKIDNIFNLQGFDIYLSNKDWSNYTKFNIRAVIPDPEKDINRNNTWVEFGVAKGDLRKIELGNWAIKNESFDWSKIDGVKLVASSKIGKKVGINIKEFSLSQDQKEARALVIFDDGWFSTMDAAKIMNKYDIKGNVAVITSSIGKKKYLSLDNLKTLQNVYGWNIVSHSNLHKNAVNEYVSKNNVKGFEADISDALQYLVQNNINSAPNWYVYPNGSIDHVMKSVISKYYKFARATVGVPVSFPFPEPLEVGVLPIYSDEVGPSEVHDAISDAVKYKQTIFLMFHKISLGASSVHTEYSLSDFDTTMKDIKRQGIKVLTLSELDEENNVAKTEFVVHNAIPGQITLDISSTHNPTITKVRNAIIKIWKYFVSFGN